MSTGWGGLRPGLPAGVVAVWVLAASLAAADGGGVRAPLGGGLVGVLTAEGEVFLEAPPLAGEGLLAFSRRLTGGEEAAPVIAAHNGGDERLLAGIRYRVPLASLTPELQRRVLEGLHPGDAGRGDGWHHRVRAGGNGVTPGASLWGIAHWFTGEGGNFRAIREYNGLIDNDPDPGETVVIPAALLRPAFRAVLPAEEDPSYRLHYERRDGEEVAVYRLQPGEALYSSVVVRFTGRVHAEDVNSLALDIARRSRIRDVTDIPVGYAVEIPFDVLLPEFLPPSHPRRVDYEASRTASAQYTNPVTARGLEGITVILDAGHGGRDVGASWDGVWESLYVYDVMVRVKRLLETHTAATVHPTTRDGKNFRSEDRDRLSYSRGHEVLTDPPYSLEDSTVGVHLRWYLANSLFRRAVRQHGDPQKVVFVSLHADSLHPSLRGAMAYIPGVLSSSVSYGKSGTVFTSRREVRESPRVSFSRGELLRAEGLSRQLAEEVIGSFTARGFGVHPYKPVRERVIRQRREWVPAVLRYNEVPAKMLLEICNMANPEDRALLQTREFRQGVAEAIVEGILRYYGEQPLDAPGLQVAGRTAS